MTQGVTRNLRDCRLRILDGAGTPATKEVTLLEGNLSWSESDPIIEIKDRGALLHLRKGDEMSIAGSVSTKYDEIYLASGGTVYQFVNKLGPYSSLVGTRDADGDVFTLDWEFYFADPTGGTGELIKFSDVATTVKDFSEGAEYNTLGFTFVSFATKPALSKADYP